MLPEEQQCSLGASADLLMQLRGHARVGMVYGPAVRTVAWGGVSPKHLFCCPWMPSAGLVFGPHASAGRPSNEDALIGWPREMLYDVIVSMGPFHFPGHLLCCHWMPSAVIVSRPQPSAGRPSNKPALIGWPREVLYGMIVSMGAFCLPGHLLCCHRMASAVIVSRPHASAERQAF